MGSMWNGTSRRSKWAGLGVCRSAVNRDFSLAGVPRMGANTEAWRDGGKWVNWVKGLFSVSGTLHSRLAPSGFDWP